MRGLKQKFGDQNQPNVESHLLQMRGLKPVIPFTILAAKVASFTDAWIETVYFLASDGGLIVASFTDAWIETSASAFNPMAYLSHLLQMRGLKPLLII